MTQWSTQLLRWDKCTWHNGPQNYWDEINVHDTMVHKTRKQILITKILTLKYIRSYNCCSCAQVPIQSTVNKKIR
jgi:hypothetical protein